MSPAKYTPTHSFPIEILNTNTYLVETTRIKPVTSWIKARYLYLATGLAPMNEGVFYLMTLSTVKNMQF
jgi:hypothetical protein